jgi:alkaline phosphatase
MTAYATGHKSCVNALGVCCAANRSTLGHANIETIADLANTFVFRAMARALGD